ncbi:MAG: hypothetical protein IKH90_10250 [Ruminococcus sp.]|nr:hypothetical protein [Ruminococcus sp.]
MIGDLTIYEFYFKHDEFDDIFIAGLFGFGIFVPAVILLVILSACKKYNAVTVVAVFSALVEIISALKSLITFTTGGFIVFLIFAGIAMGFIITAVSAYSTAIIEANMEYRPETTNRIEGSTADTQQTSDDENERGEEDNSCDTVRR